MTSIAELPLSASITVSALILAGAVCTLTGAIGLTRLKSFYERVHAPTLGATFGTGLVLLGSILCFTVLQSRPIVHELLIAAFVTLTTPVTLILLVRAALYRDRVENRDVPRDE